jgi:peptidoglycan/xylan/chitin deacetylase (PgdA/CDA1 family)
VKLWARRAVKLPVLLHGWGRRTLAGSRAGNEILFLLYHSVAGRLGLELDLEPALFTRQMEALAATERVIGYDQAVGILQAAALQNGAAPGRRVVLTFDDGYECFYTHVYPLLRRWQLPATLFVTTAFIEERRAYALEGQPPAAQPVTWEMLGEMAASGLVTLGAHTHTHPLLVDLSPDRLAAELEQPLALFQQRLGLRPEHFAYPRARWSIDTEAWVARYYRTAAIGSGAAAQAASFHPYRIPRLPVRRSDGWWFFQAKLRGWLHGEEAIYDWLHARRATGHGAL